MFCGHTNLNEVPKVRLTKQGITRKGYVENFSSYRAHKVKFWRKMRKIAINRRPQGQILT